ncbi:50S ribosomal protein L10 [Neolewinella agarilytica]|uniref:Large ribosomal subunit protein uL10 n=1 Tax=Neolewinella agarilytica TaxID=478744 RepID=A0A1H9GQL0_9BACT|nr:50S ribosomal protein L10 [Neolewinella agarilytica]SEQ52382.1 LSU ribosomal protein L10P [Neolewinella agarilytica]
MTKTEKGAAIEQLKERFENNEFFYIADASTMTAEKTTELRGMLFEKGISMQVVKNTLARKALEALPEENNYSAVFDALKGPTAIMFTEVANAPAKVIKEFRGADGERPILKAAYIASSVYTGDEQLDALAKLKSREEMISDVLTLLQSPMQNLLGALNSGGSKIAGILKTLEEREA